MSYATASASYQFKMKPFTKITMGVKGLFSYLKENHSENFIAHELHNGPVIFDGNNIVYLLYIKSKLSRQFGGEYLAFELYIEKFINEIKQCGIKPIFVFDGIHNVSRLSFFACFFI